MPLREQGWPDRIVPGPAAHRTFHAPLAEDPDITERNDFTVVDRRSEPADIGFRTIGVTLHELDDGIVAMHVWSPCTVPDDGHRGYVRDDGRKPIMHHI